MEMLSEEVYGIIGAIIAGIIFTILKLKSSFKPSNVVSEVRDVKEIVSDRLSYQERIFDERFNNLNNGIDRLEEKVNYMNSNVEYKIESLNKRISYIDGKIEKIDDDFTDHISKRKD